MARKLRLEFTGACYHVINRGSDQADIFSGEKTKAAFESCLFEACDALARALRVLRQSGRKLRLLPKSSCVKLAVAAWMKSRTQVSNDWLSRRLALGTPAALSRNLTNYRRRFSGARSRVEATHINFRNLTPSIAVRSATCLRGMGTPASRPRRSTPP